MRTNNPTLAHRYRYRHGHAHALWEGSGGGWVGGWAGGRWGGSMGSVGATNWWHHITAFAPNVPHFAPPRGGQWSLSRGTAPSTSGRGPLRRGCGLDSFPPREPTIKAGRQGPTWLPGGVANRLIGPGRRLPPFATYIEYVRRTGERLSMVAGVDKASLCPPPRGVLPRPHEAPWLVRGHAMGIRVCTGRGIRVYPGLG